MYVRSIYMPGLKFKDFLWLPTGQPNGNIWLPKIFCTVFVYLLPLAFFVSVCTFMRAQARKWLSVQKRLLGLQERFETLFKVIEFIIRSLNV